MKKCILALLCLMLVLPLNVFAENTESQPAAQAEDQSPESQPSESKPTESQPSESKPAETQPPESKPAETQPPESKPAETQPSESKPAETQPVESVPGSHTHVWDVSATVPATCTEEGATAYGCSACGAITYEILPAAGHKFSTQWTKKAAGHWHACSVCGEQSDFGKHYPGPAATEETEKQPHIWDRGEEQEDTTTLYTCEDCGITRTEGEPKSQSGINPLVWAGAGVAVLLAAAAAIALLVLPKVSKGGKYGK